MVIRWISIISPCWMSGSDPLALFTEFEELSWRCLNIALGAQGDDGQLPPVRDDLLWPPLLPWFWCPGRCGGAQGEVLLPQYPHDDGHHRLNIPQPLQAHHDQGCRSL